MRAATVAVVRRVGCMSARRYRAERCAVEERQRRLDGVARLQPEELRRISSRTPSERRCPAARTERRANVRRMTAPLSRPTPGRILVLLSFAELMGMSPWFAAAAMAPHLAARWSLDPGQVGALTSAVQLGFVAGTAVAALLNLADVLSVRWYFAACALLAAGSNLALLAAPGYGVALV